MIVNIGYIYSRFNWLLARSFGAPVVLVLLCAAGVGIVRRVIRLQAWRFFFWKKVCVFFGGVVVCPCGWYLRAAPCRGVL